VLLDDVVDTALVDGVDAGTSVVVEEAGGGALSGAPVDSTGSRA